MIRSVLFTMCLNLLGQFDLQAQMRTGFQPKEARDMASLCTVHTFLDLYGSAEEMVPSGYDHIYSSVATPLDNKFEIYRKDDLAVVEIRGSTSSQMSWMVNVYSSMIPAKGTIRINVKEYGYHFANDTSAAVHSGFSLGVVTIAEDVVEQLNLLSGSGVLDVIITGHSQGAALAQLLRAYLENLSVRELPLAMNFKTYAFASPMVGDDAFAAEYERKYCTTLSSFNIINPEDPVPSMPVSYKVGSVFNMEHAVSLMSGDEDLKSTARTALMNIFSGSLEKISAATSAPVERQVEKALGDVELPPFRQEWNYMQLENRMDLEPFDHTLLLKDPSILQNDSIMRVEQRDADGTFLNKHLYVKPPSTFHHKPYNYYVAILKRYFPDEYDALEMKVLPENL